MADKTYLADIGMDELADDLFSCIVYCKETDEHLCLAYGKTPEECMEQAKKIAWLMTNFDDIKLLISEVSEDEPTMSRGRLKDHATDLLLTIERLEFE